MTERLPERVTSYTKDVPSAQRQRTGGASPRAALSDDAIAGEFARPVAEMLIQQGHGADEAEAAAWALESLDRIRGYLDLGPDLAELVDDLSVALHDVRHRQQLRAVPME